MYVLIGVRKSWQREPRLSLIGTPQEAKRSARPCAPSTPAGIGGDQRRRVGRQPSSSAASQTLLRFWVHAGILPGVLIGGKIKRLRLERGLTQEDAAYAAGIAVSTLQRIEADEYEPRLKTIRALAKVLGVSPGELIDAD